jgi:anti-sigma regulatory factor (Ser/Thr protein kinase)/FixJ family two-component response regulator
MTFPQPSILVADSDEGRRGALQSLCSDRGWECTVVTDPKEFKQLVEAGVFDLVIADADMPGIDYKALLGQACRRKPSQLLAVVCDSPAGGPDVRMFRGNDTDVITRPFDLSWVERCMEQATISKRQETREQLAYSFVVSERTEMRFTCKQLGEAQAISLPIIARLVASRRLTETDALKIRLAVQEALLNAFEHGNLELDSRWREEQLGNTDKFSAVRKERLMDPHYANRMVSVISWFDGEAVEIVVKDQGKGFSPSQLRHANQNDLSCFGRGLTLINNAVDEVRFSCGGTEVTLIKRLPANRST